MAEHRSNIAIVGATGAVGREILNLLDEPAHRTLGTSLKLLASPRSAGNIIRCRGQELAVEALGPEAFVDVDIALFSAGGEISRLHGPRAVEAGATVIDNSSAFRMDPEIPLVIPEINAHTLEHARYPGIIANPNCSTIIALMAATPLHRIAGVERMVASTYQAASGAGAAWMDELERQAHDYVSGRPYSTDVTGRQCLFNVFSHNSAIGPDGDNEEERKMVRETHRIWGDSQPRITATCIRVPVLRAHCVSINLTLRDSLTESQAREILAAAPGVRVVDDRESNTFPEPIHASGIDDVLVGRIRADRSQPAGKGLNLFVAGDQLRKGAALNAIQIAEAIPSHGLPVGV